MTIQRRRSRRFGRTAAEGWSKEPSQKAANRGLRNASAGGHFRVVVAISALKTDNKPVSGASRSKEVSLSDDRLSDLWLVLLRQERSKISMESLILAQDERWRRA